MDDVLRLILHNETTAERVGTSVAVLVAAFVLAWLLGLLVGRRIGDPYGRYYARKLIRYIFFVIALVVIGVVWRAFAGRVGLVLGVAAAGLAFAMQEVIGAIAGWFNILSGRIFRVGDRIEMGGVRGDVIDITPLRTKIMEMGGAEEDDPTWVGGRQYTGRIVSVSNKATFTEPVFNYSAIFDYIWEELTIPVAHDSNWERAEAIMREEAEAVSRSREAERAMEHMTRTYPVPRAEVEPRVFIRATDNWMELSARFIVPVRTARTVKDEMTRKIRGRFQDEGIEIASQTITASVRSRDSEPRKRARQTRA